MESEIIAVEVIKQLQVLPNYRSLSLKQAIYRQLFSYRNVRRVSVSCHN